MASIILTIAAIIAILIGVGLILAIVLLFRKKEEKVEPDYRTFFLMGIVFVSVGIVFTLMTLLLNMSLIVGIPLFAMGLIYLIYGLENRDKWKNK